MNLRSRLLAAGCWPPVALPRRRLLVWDNAHSSHLPTLTLHLRLHPLSLDTWPSPPRARPAPPCPLFSLPPPPPPPPPAVAKAPSTDQAVHLPLHTHASVWSGQTLTHTQHTHAHTHHGPSPWRTRRLLEAHSPAPPHEREGWLPYGACIPPQAVASQCPGPRADAAGVEVVLCQHACVLLCQSMDRFARDGADTHHAVPFASVPGSPLPPPSLPWSARQLHGSIPSPPQGGRTGSL